MYGKVVSLVVILAAVAMAFPDPAPQPNPQPQPGYFNRVGNYVPTAEDYLRSPYVDPYVYPAALSPYNYPYYPYVDVSYTPRVFNQYTKYYTSY